jgi:hypothetical protein
MGFPTSFDEAKKKLSEVFENPGAALTSDHLDIKPPAPEAPPAPADMSGLDPTAGTEAEPGDESQSTYEAIAEMRARNSSAAAAGAAVGGRAAMPMSVMPARINYAPVGGPEAFAQAYGELPAKEAEAIGGVHEATAQGLSMQADQKAEEANQLAQMAENSRLREEQRSKALMEHVSNYTRMADQMAAQRFDAGRYWKNPGNVLSAFAISLLPLAGVSPEKAIGMVEAAVQKDWAAQQVDYERMQNRQAAELTTIGQLRSIYGDERGAEAAFQAQSYKAMAAKAQTVALRGRTAEERALGAAAVAEFTKRTAQLAAQANAALFQGAHIAPAMLTAEQMGETGSTFPNPRHKGAADPNELPPGPGEAPGDDPNTGMPALPPTKEERNQAAMAAAYARFRNTPVPPEARAVLDRVNGFGENAKSLLSPLAETFGMGGEDAPAEAPAATAAKAGGGGGRLQGAMAAARANLGGSGRIKAADLKDPVARTILMEAESAYGGEIPSDKAAELVAKYKGQVLAGRTLKEDARDALAAEVSAFRKFADSPRGQDQKRFMSEDETRHAGARKAAFLANYARGLEAQHLSRVDLVPIKPGAGIYPELAYEVDAAGFPVLAKNADAKAAKEYDSALKTVTNDFNQALGKFNSTVTSQFGKPGDFVPFVNEARNAATAQKKFMNALGNDREKIDRMLGVFRSSKAVSVKSMMERFGLKESEAKDVLAYNTSMKSMSNAYRNQMTGSAFSEKEAREFANLFSPDISFQRQQAIIANVLQKSRSAIEEALLGLPNSARARVVSDLQRRGIYTAGKASGAFSTPGSVPR